MMPSLNSKKILFPLALVLGGLGFGLWVWMSQNKTIQDIREVAENVNLEAEVGVDLSLNGIELTQGEAGHTEWRLTAQKAKYLQEEGRVLVDKPEVVYYLPDGKALTVSAPQGEVSQENEEATLWPRVDGDYDGNTISADKLTWTGKQSRIALTGNVELDNPRVRFTGQELAFNIKEKTLEARQGVRVVIKDWAPTPAAPEGATP